MTTHPLITLAAVPAPVSNGPDPYTYYESQGKGKGKGPPHPIIPESSSYGLIFVGVALIALILSRWLNRRSAS